MDPDFWKQRWVEGQIGFHLDAVNPGLLKFWPEMAIQPGSVVFVPLCGKSMDLIWLANQGYSVLGVEVSSIAVEQFFNENKINFQQGSYSGFSVFTASNITLINSDYFDLTGELLEDCCSVYDRAALIALPEKMRFDYVDMLKKIISPGVKILLVTLEYDQHVMNGPPFSVSDQEVHELFSDWSEITLLHECDILPEQERFRKKGLSSLIERVYMINCGAGGS